MTTKAEDYRWEIDNLDECELIEHDFEDLFNYMLEMEKAMMKFVARRNKGEIRSIKTYNEFENILGKDNE